MKSYSGLARWLLTIGLLSWAFYQVPLSEWLPLIRHLHPAWVIAAGISMGAIVSINSWKWYILLRLQGLRPTYSSAIYHYAVGYFFNSFITGTGDIKRAADMGREQDALPQAIASVLAERWTGVIGQLGLAFCTVSVILFHNYQIWPVVCSALILVISLIAIYVWFENVKDSTAEPPAHGWRRWLHQVRVAMSVYKGHRRIWWWCLFLSLLGPLLLVLIHIELAYALSFQVSPLAMLLFIPTVSVFAQLPITINGFGLQDYFMVTLLQGTLTPAEALALSMVFHALRLSVGACGGVLYAVRPTQGGRAADINSV
ncbi:flippase-like domain-containing protein [bacterium]|nr:flippase-like domain-containing protein [bacterium]